MTPPLFKTHWDTVVFTSWHHLPVEGIKFGAPRGYCPVGYHGLLRGFPVALSQWILPETYITAVILHSLLPPSSLPWWLHYSFRVSWSPESVFVGLTLRFSCGRSCLTKGEPSAASG